MTEEQEKDAAATDTQQAPSAQQSATAVSRRLAPGGGGGGAWLGGPKTGSSEKYGNTGDKKNFHLLGTDLFGNEIKQDAKGALRERFDFPPFTVLNAREGPWQERKRAWLSVGIQSEVGRGENLLKMSDTLLEPDPEKRAAMQAARGDAKTFGSGGPGDLAAGFKRTESASLTGGLTVGVTADAYRKAGEEVEGAGGTGTSIFDPVLCELSYRWFVPAGGLILDPFAGGSVRGVVAGLLGFSYHGIDLRPEQIAANEQQRALICPDANIQWVVGDSNKMLLEAPMADGAFSCPPYFDLEQYSDDPTDLSSMTWEQFVGVYRSIIRKTVERMKPNTFAVFVVGEVRDKKTGLYRGFVPLTCAAFMAAGADFYNSAILITSVGSLPIRVTKQFETSRKLGTTHQHVLCFVKGDPKIAAENIRRAAEGLAPLPQAGAPQAPASRPRPMAPPAPSASPVGPPASLAGPPAPPAPMAAAPAPLAPPAPPAPPTPATAAAPAPPAPAAAAWAPAAPAAPPRVQTGPSALVQFLGATPNARPDANWKPDEPPDLSSVDDIVLNFATDGLDWAKGARPVGLTVSTLDGKLTRFLPFRFRGGGNLDEEAVKRWFKEKVRDKRITGANTRFEVHMAREWGCDLEEQGCIVSDITHYAALLDDHRKRFAVDVLAADYLPTELKVERLDERDHASYSAAEAHAREHYTAQVTAKLRNVMWPLLEKEELHGVRQLEDEVIFPVCEMEKNGALIDLELLEQFSAECTAKHSELMWEILGEAGFAFDHSHSAWERLFEKCGLKLGNSHAESVIGAVDHPLIKKAHYAGQIASLNSKTFAAYRKNVDANGILRFGINQLRGDEGGTVSGRFSIGYIQQAPNHDNHHLVFGEGSPDDCHGKLCQWFPRKLFKSATGRFLEADAAQIEFRLLVHYSQNAALLQAYKDDPLMSYHKTMQARLKTYKPDMLYAHTKNYNFAAQYGARSIKLAFMMGFITEAEGDEIRAAKRWNDPRLTLIQEIEDAVQKAHPEARQLLDRAAHLAKPFCDDFCKKGDALHRQFAHRGFVKTLAGRRSRFRDGYKTYIALNRVLQGGGADVMKKKLVEVHRERKNTGLLLRMTVHDQIGGDAQDGTKEKVAEILNAQSYETKVPILWEVGVGPNWAEAKG